MGDRGKNRQRSARDRQMAYCPQCDERGNDPGCPQWHAGTCEQEERIEALEGELREC